jgi:SAM-dependent methyltransferase
MELTQIFNIEVEDVACNLCGARDAVPVQILTDALYHLPGAFTLQRCTRCGLMYLKPRPTADSIGAYYPANYAPYRPPIEDERFALMRTMRRRKLIKRRELIEKYSGVTAGRVLDVGCATGLFLHEMQLGGWRAAGVEPVQSAAEFARQRFGLDVFQGELGAAPFDPQSFDAITFWDVLEHTFSPSEELAHAARLLKPDGLIAINVPNWDSFDRARFGADWQGFDPPRHLYIFSRETLTQLLAQAGFRVVDWICFMPGFFAWALSVQRRLNARHSRWAGPVTQVLKFPGARLLFEPWFMWMNRRRTGPVIAVFARRVSDR